MIEDPNNPFAYSKPVQLGIFKEACTLLIRQYQIMRLDSYDTQEKIENHIRDDLVRGAQRLKRQESVPTPFRLTTEHPDLENNSRIDINIITPSSLADDGKSDLTIECKVVGENAYVNSNGLVSFTSGKYSAGTDLAGMIGFIKEGDMAAKIEKIKQKLNDHTTIKTTRNLQKIAVMDGFEDSYESEHERTELDNITLHHLFFDFVSEPAA